MTGVSITRCDTRRREEMWLDDSEHMRMYSCRVGSDEFVVIATDPSVVTSVIFERYGVTEIGQLPMPRSVIPSSLTQVGEIEVEDPIPVEIVTDDFSTAAYNLAPMLAALKWNDQ